MPKLRFRKVVKNRAIAYKIVADAKDKLLIDAIESFTYTNQHAEKLSPFDLRIESSSITDKNATYLLYKFSAFSYKDVYKSDVERVAEMIKERYKELQKEEEYVFDF